MVAHNAHTESENKIHEDGVARTYGFKGGLVPGVTVWAYLAGACVDRWGRAFLERGEMEARFRSPVYEGEKLLCRLGDDGTLEGLVGDDVRAVGRAALADGAPPTVAVHPERPLPSHRPPVTREALAAVERLGSLEWGFHAAKAGSYTEEVSDDHPLFNGPEAVAHPGWLLAYANFILSHNVALGPWIHTASRVRHLQPAVDGDALSIRGRVDSLTERKGHELVDLDLVIVANGTTPVMTVQHSAIYKLAQPA